MKKNHNLFFYISIIIIFSALNLFAQKSQFEIKSTKNGKIRLKADFLNRAEYIKIYRKNSDNFTLIKQLSSDNKKDFIDNNLIGGRKYFYKIELYRKGELVSTEFFEALADATPPEPPVIKPEPEYTNGDFNWIGWEPSASDDVRYYWVLWNTSPDTTIRYAGDTPENMHTNITKDSLKDKVIDLENNTTYYYYVKAVDYVGNESPWVGPVFSTQKNFEDDIIIAKPIADGKILISWKDEFKKYFTNNLVSFSLYRAITLGEILNDNSLISGDINLDENEFIDSNNLVDGRQYHYRLVGNDNLMVENFNLELMASPIVNAKSDATKPCEPYFTDDVKHQYQKEIIVFWNDSCDEIADSFNVYMTMDADTTIPFMDSTGFQPADAFLNNDSYVASFNTPSFCGDYYFTIKAKDIAGNTTRYIPFYKVNIDEIPPLQVKNFIAETNDDGSISLKWDEANDICDDEGLSYYIYRNTVEGEIGDSIAYITGLSFIDNSRDLELGGYYYTIRAVDKVGNISNYTNSVIGYCNRKPEFDFEDNCISESFYTFQVKDYTSHLMGAQIKYYFEFSSDSFATIYKTSGWQDASTYTLTPIYSGKKYYARVKVKLIKNGSELFTTDWSDLLVIERNTSQPSPVQNLTLTATAKGYIKLTWDAPATSQNSECNSIDYYKVYKYIKEDDSIVFITEYKTDKTYFTDTYLKYCDKEYYYKVVPVDIVGNEGNIDDCDFVHGKTSPAPVWTSNTLEILSYNLKDDTLFFKQNSCKDYVKGFAYQIGFDRDFDSTLTNYYKIDSIKIDTFITRDTFFVLPENIDINCDTLFFRVKTIFSDNRESVYSDIYSALIDKESPSAPINTGRYYVNGKANIFWSPSYDECSGLYNYKIVVMDLNSNVLSKFYYSDTLIISDTLFTYCPFLADSTVFKEYNVYIYAVDYAGNEQLADKIIKIVNRPQPPVPPVMVYYDSSRYYINDGEYYAKGDTATVFMTYKLDFSDIAEYNFNVQVALDSEFTDIFDSTGWINLSYIEPNSTDTVYYFYFKFGVNGHPGLKTQIGECKHFYFRAKTWRKIYNDTSDWSNYIVTVQDNKSPFFDNTQGGSVFQYTKRPKAVQYLDWSHSDIIENCSGFKKFVIEGSLYSSFAKIDTILEFPPDCTYTIISHYGKKTDVEEYPYWYKIHLYDNVGNEYVTSPIKTYVNNSNAVMNVIAWDITKSFDVSRFTSGPLAKIEIFSPDTVYFIKIVKSMDSTIQNDENVPFKEVDVPTNHYVDSLNLIVNPYGEDLTKDGYRYITVYLQDKKGIPIDTVRGSILFDQTPPEIISKQNIKLVSNSGKNVNDAVSLSWWGVFDLVNNGDSTSKIKEYRIFRSTDSMDIVNDNNLIFTFTTDSLDKDPYYIANNYEYPFIGKYQYIDKDVIQNMNYYYKICPVDSSNNMQTASQTLVIYTDFIPPSQPVVQKLNEYLQSKDVALVISDIDSDVEYIKIYSSVDTNFKTTVFRSDWINVYGLDTLVFTDFPDNFFNSDNRYYFKVILKDINDNKSEFMTLYKGSNEYVSTIIDDYKPEPIYEIEALRISDKIRIRWKPVSDPGNNPSGINKYVIYQADNDNITKNDTLVSLKNEEITLDKNGYCYYDISISDTTVNYFYKVAAFDNVGLDNFDESAFTSLKNAHLLAKVTKKIPKQFKLYDNFPNPFNPSTYIMFDLKEGFKGNVKVDIFNILGQNIRTLLDKQLTPGQYKIQWNGYDKFGHKVGSGIYFYRINANNEFINTKKMILIK